MEELQRREGLHKAGNPLSGLADDTPIARELHAAELALQAMGIASTVVVFGSARVREPSQARALFEEATAQGDQQAIATAAGLHALSAYYDDARCFGAMVARYSALQSDPSARLHICTGGGPGIMEAANRGAFEEGALTVGLAIDLPQEQKTNPYISPGLCCRFRFFAARKLHFVARAKALVAFPGGFGTLDEVFEVLTLVQCHKIDRVPIVLYGSRFWKELLNLEWLVSMGTIASADLALIQFADSPQQAWSQIASFYALPTLDGSLETGSDTSSPAGKAPSRSGAFPGANQAS